MGFSGSGIGAAVGTNAPPDALPPWSRCSSDIGLPFVLGKRLGLAATSSLPTVYEVDSQAPSGFLLLRCLGRGPSTPQAPCGITAPYCSLSAMHSIPAAALPSLGTGDRRRGKNAPRRTRLAGRAQPPIWA